MLPTTFGCPTYQCRYELIRSSISVLQSFKRSRRQATRSPRWYICFWVAFLQLSVFTRLMVCSRGRVSWHSESRLQLNQIVAPCRSSDLVALQPSLTCCLTFLEASCEDEPKDLSLLSSSFVRMVVGVSSHSPHVFLLHPATLFAPLRRSFWATRSSTFALSRV